MRKRKRKKKYIRGDDIEVLSYSATVDNIRMTLDLAFTFLSIVQEVASSFNNTSRSKS